MKGKDNGDKAIDALGSSHDLSDVTWVYLLHGMGCTAAHSLKLVELEQDDDK